MTAAMNSGTPLPMWLRDMYKKYTGKTGCLDSTYAADIEERREQ